jgi:hypothetical protein
MKQQMALGLAAILFIGGCKTLESETQQISWEQQHAYLKKVKDPRVFGLAIYNTPTGPQIRGGGRLHPERAAVLEMLAEAPLRPLVYLSGHVSERWPVLLDFTSGATWLEFELASQLGARPLGEKKAKLVNLAGDDIPATLSNVSSLKLGQMFIEYPLVYVRMATGSLGAMNRDVSEGPVQAVIGWDLLKKFDQIQFLYSMNQVLLTTMKEEYVPNPERLAATLPLVKNVGLCAVLGRMNGQAGNILIDPAGDFEVAADVAVSSLQLGEGIVLSNPATVPSPGGVRIGARLLEKYRVTVCPKAGVIHFETPTVLEEK